MIIRIHLSCLMLHPSRGNASRGNASRCRPGSSAAGWWRPGSCHAPNGPARMMCSADFDVNSAPPAPFACGPAIYWKPRRGDGYEGVTTSSGGLGLQGDQGASVEDTQAASTLFERVGGNPFFVALVERFYASVEVDPVLRPIYPADLAPGKAHLAAFLAQYWGGPPQYTLERGQPRLRMRHVRFAIGRSCVPWSARPSPSSLSGPNISTSLVRYAQHLAPASVGAFFFQRLAAYRLALPVNKVRLIYAVIDSAA